MKVDGYTVTVKLADDAGIAGDVLSLLQVNGSDLSIDTYSKMGKPVVLRMNGTSLGPDAENGNLCTFTISGITSDITATLAYAKKRTVTFNMNVDKAPNVSGYVYGKAEPMSVLEGRPSTLTATPGVGYDVDYFIVKGTKYGDKAEVVIPDDVETIDAYFRFSDWLGGVFSVGENTTVRFSRGNLWCDGTGSGHSSEIPKIKSFGFETNQYESTPSVNHDRSIDHISHFMWSKSAEKSVKGIYAEEGDIYDKLFTNKDANTPSPDFAVNGQQGFWRALSGDDSGEWKYLMDIRQTKYGENRRYAAAKVNDMSGLLIFPDNFSSWPSGAGDEPLSFNTNSSDWNSRNYSVEQFNVLQDNGCVFIPAAGYRSGDPKHSVFALVNFVNIDGYYWSSTYHASTEAYSLSFDWQIVDPASSSERHNAYSIRLVTDVK